MSEKSYDCIDELLSLLVERDHIRYRKELLSSFNLITLNKILKLMRGIRGADFQKRLDIHLEIQELSNKLTPFERVKGIDTFRYVRNVLDEMGLLKEG